MTERHADQPACRRVIAIGSALILSLAMGSGANGMSAFIAALAALRGWDRAAIAGFNVAAIPGLAPGGLMVGALADRFGTRIVGLAVVTATGLAILRRGHETQPR